MFYLIINNIKTDLYVHDMIVKKFISERSQRYLQLLCDNSKLLNSLKCHNLFYDKN